jgi:hypothetical protein
VTKPGDWLAVAVLSGTPVTVVLSRKELMSPRRSNLTAMQILASYGCVYDTIT